jgi:Flp pilus assembly protein TadG
MATANDGRIDTRRRDEDGSIILMTAVMMLGLFLSVGLALDISRIYAVRSDLQNAADAAALAAARELNSGSTGINDAVTRANAIANSYGTSHNPVTVANIEFSVNLNGTYVNQATAAGAPDNIRFVRVTTSAVNVGILFAVRALGTTKAVTGTATAGMSVGLNGICDYYPVAVAKDPALLPKFQKNVTYVLKFKDNTGTTINLPHLSYIVLDTPWVTGNGADETRDAVAGVSPRCTSIGDILAFSKSPSSNAVNGPKQVEGGTNTRFYTYPPGNQLTYDNAKPDVNIYGKNYESITYTEYKNGTKVTRPAQTGVDDRRLLIMPIVLPIVNGPPQGEVKGFAAFFLKQSVNGNCDNTNTKTNDDCPPGTTLPGQLLLEYAGDDIVVARGFYDPNNVNSTNLTIAVLYK